LEHTSITQSLGSREIFHLLHAASLWCFRVG
jgi:hypothetical protein